MKNNLLKKTFRKEVFRFSLLILFIITAFISLCLVISPISSTDGWIVLSILYITILIVVMNICSFVIKGNLRGWKKSGLSTDIGEVHKYQIPQQFVDLINEQKIKESDWKELFESKYFFPFKF